MEETKFQDIAQVQLPVLRKSNSIAKLAEALSKAQGKMEGAKKDSDNPFFRSKYANLASVWDACRCPLSENGLSVVQTPMTRFRGIPEAYTWISKNGEEKHGIRVPCEITLVTMLIHSSGEFIEGEFSCLLDTAEPQAVGSAITYLRRYGLQSMVGIAPQDEDDDGETAQGRGEKGFQQKGKAASSDLKATQKEVMDAALELAGGDETAAYGHIKRISTFKGDEGEDVFVSDPFTVKNAKWLSRLLNKLRDELAAKEVGQGDAVLS